MQTETALQRIRTIQKTARDGRTTSDRPKWPMIVLRSPKGWTEHSRYVREHGEDMPQIRDWTWPHGRDADVSG